mmetsp:Transcript_6760/g.11022  ORF Transcript_6760/g.11022 Transcript_6760/m.11022 type:complete len:927 (+) Transcript_6760:48-2828(+)
MGWLDNWKAGDTVSFTLPNGYADLRNAAVYVQTKGRRPSFYAEILVQEVEKRSRISLPILTKVNENTVTGYSCLVRLSVDPSQEDLGAEGFKIVGSASSDEHVGLTRQSGVPEILVVGRTERGLLFGVGRFLREMLLDFHISYSKPLESLCSMDLATCIVSRPTYRMRQHQVAYRPKTNSYDAFTVDMMKQEVLDLALFGCNAIEMIPPGVDDAEQSPNFHISWEDMLTEVSTWCDKLDIDVSIWYPAFYKDYDDPETLATAKAHWNHIFCSLPRLDVLFVPGGDPGGRPAAEFFAVVEKQAAFLRTIHPQCEVWVSSQYGLSLSVDLGLEKPWEPLEQEQAWLQALRKPEVQKFIHGAVYGPWSALPIDEFRAELPACMPLRNYPDMCHVQTAEMPVDGWDVCFAMTNNRESINPRPVEFARVIKDQAPYTIGCGCYSEGVNDDLNKYVWTVLHWGGDVEGPLKNSSDMQQLDALLGQYASFLCGMPRVASTLAEGIKTLERNWIGDLFTSQTVPESMAIFKRVEASMTPRHRQNWRLNMLLFRANHDALVYTRLQQEKEVEAQVIRMLKDGHFSESSLRGALRILDVPYTEPAIASSSFESKSLTSGFNVLGVSDNPSVTHLYGELRSLASILFSQIGYQLSIGYGGQHRQRGAFFDLIWTPLANLQALRRSISILLDDTARSNEADAALAKWVLALGNAQPESEILWYASFGDEAASETGLAVPPTRPVPVWKVLPPYRQLERGEDPVRFERLLVEYLDTSNDEVLQRLHNGWIPRAYQSYLVPIWPRMAEFSFRFSWRELLGDHSKAILSGNAGGSQLHVKITYLGSDLNRHGGDWEELNREGMPTKLSANGHLVHDFLESPASTVPREFTLPPFEQLLAGGSDELTLTVTGKEIDKCTFRYVPLPIAELSLSLHRPTSARL